ncbi:CutA1 divalent ion tolerance protein [Tolumonas auensis DSM 9187]|uniref:CutA1 divalent ion tolerance protein n=1 Tax=Tolumonas auensis (strain DSM 9187 / NBRC 110442 / TA 4) TaxID=595494 RepID=C4LCA5_TOLAT|nr:divalent-cation tolerance protein CutA [Tolumonas auensis]ACQ94409.1 CutA1 divalent ion tolerance protein [Tolumonas auensis DSM 9187]
MSDAIVVLCTCPDNTCARALAQTLLNEKLAACVNLIPQVTSLYCWQGKMEESQEVLLVIKSRRTLFGVLQQRIQTLHPYEVPEILAMPVLNGSPAYLQWLQEQTTP